MVSVKIKRLNIFLGACLFLVLFTWDLEAQNRVDGDILVVTRADGRAFIYHGEEIPLSHGYNVYRQSGNDDWVKLTEEPYFPAANGYEFEQMLGDLYPRIETITNRENPQAVFLRLRSNSDIGLLTSFSVPEVAEAVGRLYIDESAPVGETVSYRFEIVDDLERPVGTQIEGSSDLEPIFPPSPSKPEITHEGRRVTAKWSYQPSGNNESGNVIRFQIYYQIGDEEEIFKAHEEFIARTIQQTQYQFTFEVPEMGRNYTFTVHAVDFTGQMSDASESTTLSISQNIPPDIIRNVQAEVTDDYQSFITWPVSTSLELAGYNIYRARGDEEVYNLLTRQLLDPLETAFIDSTVEPGNQYRYSVTAVDSFENESKRSNPAHVLITDYRRPDPVDYLTTVFQEDRTIQMKWNSNDVPGGLRNYLLLRRQINPAAGNSFTQVNSERLTDTSYVDPGVGDGPFVEGATYEYGISVVSNNGNYSDTLFTEIKIPDLTPPNPPSMLRVAMEEGQRVSLTWNASSSTDVNRYIVYRENPVADSDSLLAELERSKRYFRDEQIEIGNTYRYHVASVDSAGNESELISDSITTSLPHPPASVRNLQVIFIDNEVLLSWESNNKLQIDGFRIYKSEIATGVYELLGETDKESTSWTDSSGTAGEWYKVFPIDASGREARTARATQATEHNSR